MLRPTVQRKCRLQIDPRVEFRGCSPPFAARMRVALRCSANARRANVPKGAWLFLVAATHLEMGLVFYAVYRVRPQ